MNPSALLRWAVWWTKGIEIADIKESRETLLIVGSMGFSFGKLFGEPSKSCRILEYCTGVYFFAVLFFIYVEWIARAQASFLERVFKGRFLDKVLFYRCLLTV